MKRHMLLAALLMTTLVACGDPSRSVVVVNESNADLVVGLQTTADYARPDGSIPAGKMRVAFGGAASANGELVTVWSESCDVIMTAPWLEDGMEIRILPDMSSLVTNQASTQVGGIVQDADDSTVVCSPKQ